MKLYNSLGYANMPDIIESETPFVLTIGGRGTGKTYGAIKYLLENNLLISIYVLILDIWLESILISQLK